MNCCKCRHNAWVSKILLTLAQPIDTFRNLLPVPLLHQKTRWKRSSCAIHVEAPPVGSWWLNSWRTCERGMVAVLGAASAPKRQKQTTQQICKSKPSLWHHSERDSVNPTFLFCALGLWFVSTIPDSSQYSQILSPLPPSHFILCSSNICLDPHHFYPAIPEAPTPLNFSSAWAGGDGHQDSCPVLHLRAVIGKE